MNDIAFFSYAYAIAQFWEILKKFQIFCRMKVFSGKITPIANVRSVEFSEIIKPINSLINSCMQISWDLYQMLFTRNCVHSSQIRIRIRFFLQNICSFTVLVVYKYKWGKLHKFHLNGLESVRKFNAKPSQHGKKNSRTKKKEESNETVAAGVACSICATVTIYVRMHVVIQFVWLHSAHDSYR